MKLILNPEYGLYEKGGRAFCDSLQVAETFGKRHDNVLRDIEQIIQSKFEETEEFSPLKIEETENFSPSNFGLAEKFNLLNFEEIEEFSLLNFELTYYKDGKGRNQPKYFMTKDGFALLVVGYTGKKAMGFKIAFIKRFNEMDSFIKSMAANKVEFPAFVEAIALSHDDPRGYHYSNEINMIYRIVLGVDTKAFRQSHGLETNAAIKPYLTAAQLSGIGTLQRVDIGLIEAGLTYAQRKETLTRRHQRSTMKLLA
jgi:Rha family phage regulatory protein